MNSSFLRSRPARRSFALGLGLIAVTTLAGCAQQPAATQPVENAAPAPAPATAPATQAPAAGAPSAPSVSPSSSPSAAASGFTDGSYSATGDYTSPGGPSSIAVTVTLKAGVVTAVKVVPKASDPTAQQYESLFSSGISGQIVGKKITELNVTKVSGSSLTSQGFDSAIADIEQQATA